MSLVVISLGCRLNLSEGEEMRSLLGDAQDLTVINSCAVTAEAVRQTRQAIRRARKARPHARLLVTGCGAEVEREALAAMPEVDGLVGNADKLDRKIYSSPLAGEDSESLRTFSLAKLGEGGRPSASPSPSPTAASSLRSQAFVSSLARGEEVSSTHTRAFVQVQNGCDHACTFCIIPQGRGASRSFDVRTVIATIERHLEQGVKEVVLTGVDVTSWGADLPGEPRLGALITAILQQCPALPRLRLSSLDGIEIDQQLFDLIASEPRMMPHLHLSLQSGDDLILKRMKRRHSRRDALDLVARLRARRPDIAIGADIIAGFPTEDESAHLNNLSIIAELHIVHGHIFPYSIRPGTPAARMPQVDHATIKRRAAELRAAVAAERRNWLAAQLGRPLDVLAERDGTGHASNFARVQLPEGTAAGSLVRITPTRVIEGLLA